IGIKNSFSSSSPGVIGLSLRMILSLSDNPRFPHLQPSFRPSKAQTKLIVYPNAVLSRPVAFERFQSIRGWYWQVFQPASDFQLSYLASPPRRDVHKPRDTVTLGQGPRVRAPERLDHSE